MISTCWSSVWRRSVILRAVLSRLWPCFGRSGPSKRPSSATRHRTWQDSSRGSSVSRRSCKFNFSCLGEKISYESFAFSAGPIQSPSLSLTKPSWLKYRANWISSARNCSRRSLRGNDGARSLSVWPAWTRLHHQRLLHRFRRWMSHQRQCPLDRKRLLLPPMDRRRNESLSPPDSTGRLGWTLNLIESFIID